MINPTIEQIFRTKRRVTATCDAIGDLLETVGQRMQALQRCRCVCDEGCPLCEDQAADLHATYVSSLAAASRAVSQLADACGALANHAAEMSQPADREQMAW